MSFTSHGPEPCASANSAISAKVVRRDPICIANWEDPLLHREPPSPKAILMGERPIIYLTPVYLSRIQVRITHQRLIYCGGSVIVIDGERYEIDGLTISVEYLGE